MSYHHHNWHIRALRRAGGPCDRAYGERGCEDQPAWAVAAYPENLTAKDMLFFLAVPTLVYQVGGGALPTLVYQVGGGALPTLVYQVGGGALPTLVYQVGGGALPTLVYQVGGVPCRRSSTRWGGCLVFEAPGRGGAGRGGPRGGRQGWEWRRLGRPAAARRDASFGTAKLQPSPPIATPARSRHQRSTTRCCRTAAAACCCAGC
jgi:hypothetical protein